VAQANGGKYRVSWGSPRLVRAESFSCEPRCESHVDALVKCIGQTDILAQPNGRDEPIIEWISSRILGHCCSGGSDPCTNTEPWAGVLRPAG
jgi:hypothetical protein